MLQFSMFVPTKANVKQANVNKRHDQVIGTIVCCFPKFSIIYPVGQVYYFSGHPYNIISSDSLKCYVGFQKVMSEPLEHCGFVDPQGLS